MGEKCDTFESLVERNLMPSVYMKYVKEAGFDRLTPVQHSVIPLLDRRDVIVEACTGSGKTLAFLIPMLRKLHWVFDRLRYGGIRSGLLSTASTTNPSRKQGRHGLKSLGIDLEGVSDSDAAGSSSSSSSSPSDDDNPRWKGGNSGSGFRIVGLVLAPTRELSMQIYEVLNQLLNCHDEGESGGLAMYELTEMAGCGRRKLTSAQVPRRYRMPNCRQRVEW
eukprot:GHVU01015347.1.p1 GENE.GHVU01015347.1~~GHVU01015347.1.p1  ORF type:complete len:221 (-),score=21.20 GHVU01015347.1:93-755(-)